MIGISATYDSVSTDCYRDPCRLWCRRFSILDTAASSRRSMRDVRHVDDATTACLISSHVIPGWVVSCMNTCGIASLIYGRRAALLVSSALAFPSTSISPQMVSNFTIKSADYSGELARSSRLRSNASSCTAAGPVRVLHTRVPAPAKLLCRRGCRRVRIAAADPLAARARRSHKDCVLRWCVSYALR